MTLRLPDDAVNEAVSVEQKKRKIVLTYESATEAETYFGTIDDGVAVQEGKKLTVYPNVFVRVSVNGKELHQKSKEFSDFIESLLKS